MKVKNPQKWQEFLDANPCPEGLERDPDTWPDYKDMTSDQQGDGYGFTVVLFAERWADTMESILEVDPVIKVEDVAKRCADRVDGRLGQWGLTGFQYGAAVETLAQCWEYGEDLRRWHNLDTQIRDEGERANEAGTVLNPAVLQMERPLDG